MSRGKKLYFSVLILTVIMVSTMYFSYGIFTNKIEEHGKLNIIAGTLDYRLESDFLENNQVTIGANTMKKLFITLTSLNEIDSKYELYYLLKQSNNNVKVEYSVDTKDLPNGTIHTKEKKQITVIIRNPSNESITVEFKTIGGYVRNELELVEGNRIEKERVLALKEAILTDNTLITKNPTLTTSSNNTNDASGLYRSNATNNGKYTYYFRGDVKNNYVEFAGFTWRVVRINEDETIRLITQKGINNNAKYPFNPNYDNYTYMYYSNSNTANGAKNTLDNWYKTNITNKGYSSYVASGNYFCEQAKVAIDTRQATNSKADMTVYTEYTPNFRCTKDKNGYGIVNASVGLITYDETALAGGYHDKPNNSYYLYNGVAYWTMSPGGFTSSAGSWNVTGNGMMRTDDVFYESFRLRLVLNLNTNVLITGTGFGYDPYIIQTS